MDRTRPDASPTIIRQEDIDPWAEFLSESSEELQALQSSVATTAPTGESAATPVASTASATQDTVDVTSLPEPGATTPGLSAGEAEKSDVVRVSIAQLTPDVEADAYPASDVAASESRDDNAAPRTDERNPVQPLPPPDSVTPFDRHEVREPLAPHWSRSIDHSQRTVPATSPSLMDDRTAPGILAQAQPEPLPEPPAPPIRSVPTPAVLATALSLRDVLKRQTPVHWSEAVAVVEELCSELAAISEVSPPIPDLADILITSAGQVTVRAGAHGDRDVAMMGRTLHALLASSTTPLPLRLFVTSSISSERFKSVALFADALSYYGMPRRTELIRTLYHRASSSVATVAPVASVEKAIPSPVPITKAVYDGPRKGRRSHTVLWAAAIFTGVLIGTAAALSLMSTPPKTEMTRSKSASEGVGTPPKQHDDWQLGAVTVGTGAKNKKPAAAARTDARPKSNGQRASGAVAPPDRTSSIPSVVQASPVPQTSAPVRPLLAPPPDLRVTPPTPPATVAIQPADPNVYSEQDRDVAPPVLVSKRPSPPPPSSPTDSQVSNTVELVIDLTGHVSTVKMLERPTRLTDTLSLQEYKNLRFKPAMKDGHPVQYRYVLRTVVSPR